jgi:hypothetical protein
MKEFKISNNLDPLSNQESRHPCHQWSVDSESSVPKTKRIHSPIDPGGIK